MQKNKHLKADHTLEFPPLNYSFTKKNTEKEIAFLVWYHNITISPNYATCCLIYYEAREKIYWLTYR